MNKRQFAALFICSLVPLAAGNGLVPLLPVYAGQLGANAAGTGYFLAGMYLALTVGALSAGWVSGRLHRAKLPLIVAGLISIPATWLLGQVRALWALAAVASLSWLAGGLELALINILTGLSVRETERGKIFGILALTNGLGALVGGLGIGWLVDSWGYRATFTVLTLWAVVLPLGALFLAEKEVAPPQLAAAPPGRTPALGRDFFWLLAATLLSAIPAFFVLLIRSLVMDKLGFGSLEITSTSAIAGLVSMPFPFLLGWASDRIGRKTLLGLAFLCGLAALAALSLSTGLWHFQLALVLNGIAVSASALASALATDLVPRESLGKALAEMSAAPWLGGVAGFAIAGIALQQLGLWPTLILGGCLTLAAMALLVPIKTGLRPGAAQT